jgi:hypothetical protein
MEMMLDTDRGQFDCPLCKRLSNLLVPITRVHLPASAPATDSSRHADADVTAVCGEMGMGCRRLSETRTGRTGDEEPRKRKTVGASSAYQEADKASKKTQRPESSRGERGVWSEAGAPPGATSDWFTVDDGHMFVVDYKSVREATSPRAGGSSSSGSGGESLPSWVMWMNNPVLVRRVPVRVKGEQSCIPWNRISLLLSTLIFSPPLPFPSMCCSAREEGSQRVPSAPQKADHSERETPRRGD